MLAFERAQDGDRRLVLVSFADQVREMALGGAWQVAVRSVGGEPWSARLAAGEAVVLRPA